MGRQSEMTAVIFSYWKGKCQLFFRGVSRFSRSKSVRSQELGSLLALRSRLSALDSPPVRCPKLGVSSTHATDLPRLQRDHADRSECSGSDAPISHRVLRESFEQPFPRPRLS